MSFISLVVALLFLSVVAVVVGLLTTVECKLRRLEREVKSLAPDVGLRVTLPSFVWRWQEARLRRILIDERPKGSFRIFRTHFRIIVRKNGWVVTLLSDPCD